MPCLCLCSWEAPRRLAPTCNLVSLRIGCGFRASAPRAGWKGDGCPRAGAREAGTDAPLSRGGGAVAGRSIEVESSREWAAGDERTTTSKNTRRESTATSSRRRETTTMPASTNTDQNAQGPINSPVRRHSGHQIQTYKFPLDHVTRRPNFPRSHVAMASSPPDDDVYVVVEFDEATLADGEVRHLLETNTEYELSVAADPRTSHQTAAHTTHTTAHARHIPGRRWTARRPCCRWVAWSFGGATSTRWAHSC